MKFSSSIVVASLASTSLAAHRGRHARFHAERDVDFELHTKRALESDPTLAKRCGEMINTTYPGSSTPMSFPNCFLACQNSPECGAGAAASPPAPADPPAAPAPAATSAAPVDNDVKVNAAVPAAATTVINKAQESKPSPTPAASSSGSGSSSGSSSSSGSGGMVGLAYNEVSLITGEWLSGKAAWAYNWGYSGAGLNGKLQYVPMFHDDSQRAGFKQAGFSGNGPLLSLNEPDMPASAGGCDMSPAAACAAHKDAFSGYSGHSVSSPSVTSTDNDPSKGLAWLQSFHSACSDAKVDFVALHWYGAGGQSGEAQGKLFMDYVTKATKAVDAMWQGKPIWFTEVAAIPVTDATVNAEFLAYVMNNIGGTRVERIAPFMVGNGGALGTTSPNNAGKVLLGLS